MFDVNRVKAIISSNIRPQSLKILFFLLCHLEDNVSKKIKRMAQVEIAEELGITCQNISRAMKELEKNSIIYKSNRDYYFSKDLFLD